MRLGSTPLCPAGPRSDRPTAGRSPLSPRPPHSRPSSRPPRPTPTQHTAGARPSQLQPGRSVRTGTVYGGGASRHCLPIVVWFVDVGHNQLRHIADECSLGPGQPMLPRRCAVILASNPIQQQGSGPGQGAWQEAGEAELLATAAQSLAWLVHTAFPTRLPAALPALSPACWSPAAQPLQSPGAERASLC